jgi:hypothetical protein
MTPRTPLPTPRLLPILALAIAATALLAPRPLHAEPPKPCALLSPLQIKAVLPTPLLAGKPGSPTDGTADCTRTDPKGETRVYLSLNDPGSSYKSFRDSMLATGRLVPLSGLAGDAFFVSSAGNSAAHPPHPNFAVSPHTLAVQPVMPGSPVSTNSHQRTAPPRMREFGPPRVQS